MKTIVAFIISFFLLSNLQAQTIINVENFGVRPNSFVDATEGVKQAIDACRGKVNVCLYFPEGRYDFWPTNAEQREYFISNTSSEEECPSKVKNIGLLFEGFAGLELEGNNSLFVFHGKTISWVLDNCQDIVIKNLRIDYERPTMSELTFEEICSDHLIASVHPDSKYDIINDRLEFYGENWKMRSTFSILTDTVERTELYSSFDPLYNSKATEIALNKLRFEGDFSNTNYRIGKTLTIRDPYRDHVGAFIRESKNIKLENISMHYMHGLGIVSQFSENLSYSKVKVMPSRNRTIASFADGMHFSGCRGDILVDGCHFSGLHDDPMNVHGTYLKITEIISSTKLKLRFMHNQTYGFQAFREGDTIAYIRPSTLYTMGRNTIKSAKLVSRQEMEIELQEHILKDLKVGDCLENITWTPSLVVRNCYFGMTNTRGLLITTPRKVVVENNHFYRTGMYAIQIAGDAGSWYESGAVNDVTIRNNVFEECGYNRGESDSYSIVLNPENHEYKSKHWVHRNIRIEDNQFIVFDDLILKARSTKGILFRGNMVKHSDWQAPYKNESSDNKYPTFLFEDCNDVRLEKNLMQLKDPVSIKCEKMKKRDIKLDDKRINLIIL